MVPPGTVQGFRASIGCPSETHEYPGIGSDIKGNVTDILTLYVFIAGELDDYLGLGLKPSGIWVGKQIVWFSFQT